MGDALKPPSSTIEIVDVSHRYPGHAALNGVSLTVSPHEVTCIVGPSGCGKSTLLRLISGLETLQTGSISIGGVPVAVPGRSLPPERRPVGLMFQDFALFPHLTVSGNVAFGLRHRPRAEREARVAELLELVALTRYADAYPHTLSGGQQQRVALARAMSREPDVLLLDEPFSALDEQMRRSVREEVVQIIRATGIATLVVTHDPEEAMEIGSRVVVMTDGRIVQADTPLALYHNPANSFVAQLFGELNRFSARVVDGHLDTPLGRFPVPADATADALEVACRVEDVAVLPPGSRPDGIAAKVRRTSFLGSTTRVCLSLPAAGVPEGVEIHARLPGYVPMRAGDEVTAAVDPRRLMLFRAGA
ncbi:sulfate ABC transporter ATP-binding protein [Azospirillum sp. TSO22-1]|nr:sulfate ABC transporter ATP-binding protein [Azospirillum sp. TSO22-1]